MTNFPFLMETQRLRIRPFREEDCAAEVFYLGEESVTVPLISVPFPFTYADAMAFFRKMRKTYDADRPEFFVLADQGTDEMIGAVGMHPEHTLKERPFVAEIGYWLGKPFWGQGYLAEVLPTLLSFGFDRLGLRMIVATTNTDNQRSQNVLRRAGFSYLGDFPPLVASERGTALVTSWELTRDDFKGVSL